MERCLIPLVAVTCILLAGSHAAVLQSSTILASETEARDGGHARGGAGDWARTESHAGVASPRDRSLAAADAAGASTAAAEIATAATTASLTSSATRRALAALPSSLTNGSASATFPSAAFAAWCAADSACAAADAGGGLALRLLHHADAAAVAAVTSSTINWPSPFSGAGVSNISLVSGLVELQLAGLASKQDAAICAAASPCVAQLSIPLTSAADPSLSFVCLRLEPTLAGSSYQAAGYPPGSDGTAISGIILNGALRCNTTKFGRHVIMQYRQAPLTPPPPPSSPPPPSGPLLNATGAKYTSDVQLEMTLAASLSFDALKADGALLSSLTSSLTSTLTSSLGGLVPAMLLLSSVTNSTGRIVKISRYGASPLTAISIQFRLVVPAGATEGQISALKQLVATSTPVLFTGSPYTPYFIGPASVVVLAPEHDDALSSGAIVALTLGCLVAGSLLALAAYGLYRWRAYAAILPKKPDGEYDTYGELLVKPRKGTHRQSIKDQRIAPDPAAPAAHPAPSSNEGGAAVPPPWNGADAPPPPPPLAVPAPAAGPAGGGPSSTAVPVGEDTRDARYGAPSTRAAAGGAGLRAHAELGSARMAWS
ncbi:hypothetical protein GPECTOR_60g699 [Gonium pectorale]|uniref:Pherophorin domain-containing protein n=1 Tax=Gonium pectorale TaxID=33097 RepID=A0A150G4Y7_GONPE|nr:hypothetical protein GPECTOR_60g699 [Gonium pectorale]|eukprot:KXZ44922.1 hypothetical protein GPECTOR_60g699 [Gonium pectorale]